jgi:hypothetical protein
MAPQYCWKLHAPRLPGLALEWADRYLLPDYAGAGPDDAALVLYPSTPNEITVTNQKEPSLRKLLRWAVTTKRQVHQKLEAAGCLLRGPLEFPGTGPWPASENGKYAERRGGVQTLALINGTEKVSVDLRFAVKDTAQPCQFYSCSTEQKFSRRLHLGQKDADADRDGKILRAAKAGSFRLPGVHIKQPRTARAAACASLAITPTAWSFKVQVRSDHPYPPGLLRSLHGTFPDDSAPFPHELLKPEAAPAAARAAAPASKRAARPGAAAKQKPAAKPARAIAKGNPAAASKASKSKGGRSYQPKGRQRRCSDGKCNFQPISGASAEDRRKNFKCQHCKLQPKNYKDVPKKFVVDRCGPGVCRQHLNSDGTCTICKRKPQ